MGRNLLYSFGLWKKFGVCQFSSSSGSLDWNLAWSALCLFKFVSQAVSPVCPWKARSPMQSYTLPLHHFDLKFKMKKTMSTIRSVSKIKLFYLTVQFKIVFKKCFTDIEMHSFRNILNLTLFLFKTCATLYCIHITIAVLTCLVLTDGPWG